MRFTRDVALNGTHAIEFVKRLVHDQDLAGKNNRAGTLPQKGTEVAQIAAQMAIERKESIFRWIPSWWIVLGERVSSKGQELGSKTGTS